MVRLKKPAAFIAAMLLLCACDRQSGEEQQITVISDGTSVTVPVSEETVSETEYDPYAWVSDKELMIPEGMETRYASLSYDDRSSDVYEKTLDSITKFKESELIPLTVSLDDYLKIMDTIRCEQLVMSYVAERDIGEFSLKDQTFRMNFKYKYSIKEMNIMLYESEQAAKEIIAETEGMNDYEKLKYFHDYLAVNVESSADDPYGDSVYGALVNKKALCEGYAKAFSYLCNLAGIENMIITGVTDVAHMWNMVKLEDSWYHVDVGFDKPAAALSEKYPDMVLHQYFLVDDTVIENNRTVSTDMCIPPVADSDENYFRREGLYAESYDEALEIISKACASCIDSGEKYFGIKLDSSNLYLQTIAKLGKAGDDGISDMDRIVSELNFRGVISYIDFYESYRIIIFVLE